MTAKSHPTPAPIILILAPAVPLQTALYGLLNSIPSVGRVEIARDINQALSMASEIHPRLVLIAGYQSESGRSDGINPQVDFKEELALRSPNCKLAVLVDTMEEFPDWFSGCDRILQQNLQPKDLVLAIEELIEQE